MILSINPEQLVHWREQLVLQDTKTGFFRALPRMNPKRGLQRKLYYCRSYSVIKQEFVRPRWPYDMRPSAEKYMCVIVIR